MKLTIFPDRYARDATESECSWSALCDWIASAPIHSDKESLPLLKLATFGTDRTTAGCLRHDANMIAVHGIEGDYDGGEMPIEYAADLLREAGVQACLYTSASHMPEAPRWRVLAPLSAPCMPSERVVYAERLNGVLGGVLAAESFTASQAFHVGRVEGKEFVCAVS